MAEFTLDTSGGVRLRPDSGGIRMNTLWSDLDAFTQGYVEAVLKDAPATGPLSNLRFPAFSDLAPETLAAILKDCAARQIFYVNADENTEKRGAGFWCNRHAGKRRHCGYPPLTAYLGDDGRVYLREAQADA